LHLDPQIEASGILEEIDHPVMGRVRQPAPAPRVDGVRPAAGSPAPRIGAQTRDVLREHGWSNDEVDALSASGVIATDDE
jgi:crotonobetainyl-CoA:carnitine CoA-transferase CaiB-like acyl-CoA transferase